MNKSIQEIFRIFRTYYVKDLFQFCFCVNNENWEEKSRKKCGKMCVHDLLVVWYCYIDCYCAMSIHVNMNRYKYSFLSLLLLLFFLLLFFMRLAISFLWCENEVERNDVFAPNVIENQDKTCLLFSTYVRATKIEVKDLLLFRVI